MLSCEAKPGTPVSTPQTSMPRFLMASTVGPGHAPPPWARAALCAPGPSSRIAARAIASRPRHTCPDDLRIVIAPPFDVASPGPLVRRRGWGQAGGTMINTQYGFAGCQSQGRPYLRSFLSLLPARRSSPAGSGALRRSTGELPFRQLWPLAGLPTNDRVRSRPWENTIAIGSWADLHRTDCDERSD